MIASVCLEEGSLERVLLLLQPVVSWTAVVRPPAAMAFFAASSPTIRLQQPIGALSWCKCGPLCPGSLDWCEPGSTRWHRYQTQTHPLRVRDVVSTRNIRVSLRIEENLL